MTRWLNNPFFLLLGTGSLLGFYFPLGKIAGLVGISPLVWAMVISLGAVIFLLPILVFQGKLTRPRGREIRYILISGLISYVVPNGLALSAVPHTGAGFAGLMFALSPVFTLTLSMILKVQKNSVSTLIALGLGLIGAFIIVISKNQTSEGTSLLWMCIALLVPVCISVANIYRTIDWPVGTNADFLAFWSHMSATGYFIIFLIFTGTLGQTWSVFAVPDILVWQLLAAGLTFPLYFRLQEKGGPVMLSQIGYVAAAVGLVAATVLLDERYSLSTWAGALVIILSIIFTYQAQSESQKTA